MSDMNPLNLDCWFEGDEIVFASGERMPRHKWYPVRMNGPLVTKQAAIIAGFTEQVGELKAALAASEQRAATAEAHAEEANASLYQAEGEYERERAEHALARYELERVNGMVGVLREALKPFAEMESEDLFDSDGGLVEVWSAPPPIIAQTALAATPPHPEQPATMDDGPQAWCYALSCIQGIVVMDIPAEERIGAIKGVLMGVPLALSATPPPAAPSVPDAAGAEEQVIREIAGGDHWVEENGADYCYFCGVGVEDVRTGEGHRDDCIWVRSVAIRDALTPAAQRAPAGAGPGDDAGGGTA